MTIELTESRMFLILFVAFLLCSGLYDYLKRKGKTLFELRDNLLSIHQTKEFLFSFEEGIQIPIDRISHVQVASNCLSIFERDGTAHDVWLKKKHRDQAIQELQSLLPDVDFVYL